MSQNSSSLSGNARKTHSGSILIIDDDPDFLLVHSRMLTSAGYQVFQAETGIAGLSLARGENIDVVLLDMNLPDGNGVDLCRQIKDDPYSRESYVIIFSGMKTSSQDQALGLRAGAEGYMTKPLQEEELLARLETAIRLKKSEDILRFERSQLLSIFNSIDEIIYVIDPYTYEILFANQAMRNAFGKELVGEICYRALQNKEVPCEFCTNQIVLQNRGMPYQWEHFNPALNKHLLITDKIIKWPDKRDVRFEFAIDITQRKQAEEALQRSEERFKLAMDATKDGLWDLNVITQEVYFSPGYTSMLGYPPDSVVPSFQFWKDNVHPDDIKSALRSITDCIENRLQHFDIQFRMKTRNNEWRWVQGRGNAVTRDEAGRATRMVGTHTDITDRKLAEKKILEKNRELHNLASKANILAAEAQAANQAKSDFLANMSHEIRTPLNGVIGMTGLLLDTKMTQEQRGLANHIQSSGEMLLDLINDILDFSKIEAGRLELENIDFNLHELLKEISALIRHQTREKGLVFKNFIDTKVPEVVMGDPGRLRQILVNLLNNAIKFTDNGQIEMKAALASDQPQKGIKLLFSVHDTGIGIAEESLHLLFEKFHQIDSSTTRKYGGTGLGLAISKQLAQCMGGEIGAKSQENQGSEFWFTVVLDRPLNSTGRESSGKAAYNAELPHLSGHILVAEDTPVNQKVAIGILNKLGLTADVAASGIEAVKALEHRSYDLIIMDVHMPDMDGLSATRKIRDMEREKFRNSEKPGRDPKNEIRNKISSLNLNKVGLSYPGHTPEYFHLPIIAMTAGAMHQDKEKCMEAGMDDYLSKPINIEDLARVLARWLPQSKGGRRPDPVGAIHPIETDLTKQKPAEESTSEPPAFDKRGLLDRLDNDLDFAREILNIYLESTPANIKSLKTSLNNSDLQKATREAHAIKGNSYNAGCMAMADTAKKMENAGKSGAVREMKDFLPELERRFEKCARIIRNKDRRPSEVSADFPAYPGQSTDRSDL